MKLVSMANKPKEQKEGENEAIRSLAECDSKYPYGTQLQLGNDQLQALGISDLPKVGTVVSVMAKAKVISVRSEEGQDGTADQSFSLQITDLGIDQAMSMSEKAGAMFGDSNRG